MKDIKLVVSDVDRTLIMNREDFPKQVVEAVKKLTDKGILFTFASGRLPYMIDPYLELMGLDIPVISCSGGRVYHKEKILVEHTLEMKKLRALTEYADSLDMTILYSMEGQEYCYRETEGAKRKKAERGYYHPLRPIETDKWATTLIDKMNIMDDTGAERLPMLLKEESKVDKSIAFTHYSDSALEITVGGVNKATGIQELCRYLGLEIQQVMAIGDNENDFEMVKQAGIGVAVGNAKAELKALADYVCENKGPDGVVEAIERFCL